MRNFGRRTFLDGFLSVFNHQLDLKPDAVIRKKQLKGRYDLQVRPMTRDSEVRIKRIDSEH